MIQLTTEERTKYKKILGSYNILTALIKILDIEINSINSSKYRNDINTLNHLKLLNNNKKYYKDIISKIDIGLNKLNYKEKKLVQLRYLSKNPYTWYQIGDILHFSDGYCRTKLNNKCLYKLFKIENN